MYGCEVFLLVHNLTNFICLVDSITDSCHPILEALPHSLETLSVIQRKSDLSLRNEHIDRLLHLTRLRKRACLSNVSRTNTNVA